MKAIQSIGRFLPGVIISFALMSASLEVSSQNKGNHKFDKNKDRKEYRNDHSNSSHYSDGRNDGRRDDKKYYSKHKEARNDGNYEYSQRYSKRSYQADRDYFNHPKYGRVYQRFDDKPIVFRHSHGDYYYSGNQFYTYRNGIGYCATETPRQVYFQDLPFSCSRVRVNNHEYYRHNNLYFSYSPRGYVIVPSPIEVNFSVRF